MRTIRHTHHSLGDYLPPSTLTVGEPDVVDALAVFPVFGPDPQLDYASFAQARAAGAHGGELEEGASVNDLLVVNPSDRQVLLYEGEEVVGAQQNRTFDVSVLVGAGAKLTVPVSCVEAGRWDGSRHGAGFSPAPQAAYPSLRRMKNAQARVTNRAVQSAVWDEVEAKRARHDAASATGALDDVYAHRRGSLDEFRRAVSRRDRQCGALVALGGRFDVLDLVSRSDVFASLHGPPVEGYALDALEAPTRPAPSVDAAETWLFSALEARVEERDGVGLGRDLRLDSDVA